MKHMPASSRCLGNSLSIITFFYDKVKELNLTTYFPGYANIINTVAYYKRLLWTYPADIHRVCSFTDHISVWLDLIFNLC